MEQQRVTDASPPPPEAPASALPPPPEPSIAPGVNDATADGGPGAADFSNTVVTSGTGGAARRKPNIAAAIAAGLIAVAVFVVILLILNSRSRPGLARNSTAPPPILPPGVSGGMTTNAGEPPARQPVSVSPGSVTPPSVSPGSISPTSVSPVGAPGAGSGLVIYWRFAERDYFTQHPKASKKAIVDTLRDGDSASIVRVDVENHGASTLTLDPKDFVLSNGVAMISPEQNLLPGTLALTHIPRHGSTQGWVLFVKPWMDDAQVTDYLSESALPGAHISVSQRAQPAAADEGPGTKDRGPRKDAGRGVRGTAPLPVSGRGWGIGPAPFPVSGRGRGIGPMRGAHRAGYP